jgi:hypothetical protein
MQHAAQGDAGHRTAGSGERSHPLPAFLGDIIHETLVVRPAILLDTPPMAYSRRSIQTTPT